MSTLESEIKSLVEKPYSTWPKKVRAQLRYVRQNHSKDRVVEGVTKSGLGFSRRWATYKNGRHSDPVFVFYKSNPRRKKSSKRYGKRKTGSRRRQYGKRRR